MNCDSIRGELVAYLQDELSGPRRAEVERHLGDCRSCSTELDDFRTTQKAVVALRVDAASSGFEQQVRDRISAKVAELRARGSVRFRTGRERNEEAAKWPGLGAWLRRKKRLLIFFAAAVLPVAGLFALAWYTVVMPYFHGVDKDREASEKVLRELKRGRSFQLRQTAQRRNLAVSEEGWVSGADFLGSRPVRLIPVIEPEQAGHPVACCVYAFTPAQWQAFLAQERIWRHTPHYSRWTNMVDSSLPGVLEKGRLQLPADCFSRVLGEPAEVTVLTIGGDHYEIWDRQELEDYLRPRTELAPAKPAGAGD